MDEIQRNLKNHRPVDPNLLAKYYTNLNTSREEFCIREFLLNNQMDFNLDISKKDSKILSKIKDRITQLTESVKYENIFILTMTQKYNFYKFLKYINSELKHRSLLLSIANLDYYVKCYNFCMSQDTLPLFNINQILYGNSLFSSSYLNDQENYVLYKEYSNLLSDFIKGNEPTFNVRRNAVIKSGDDHFIALSKLQGEKKYKNYEQIKTQSNTTLPIISKEKPLIIEPTIF